MPELPEVETVKNVLKKSLLGKTINRVEVRYKNIIETNINLFNKNIKGEKFIDIKRLGKYLIFELTNYYLVSHLRMEGKYFLKPESDKIEKHEHVIFYLDDITLRYHDTRKFGRMYLVDKDKLYTDTPLSHIGKEPKDLTVEYLSQKLNRNKPIKTLLLDQDIIAGIGNIYADEICFYSKIHPTTLGNKLKDKDIKNIIKYTNEILDKAIKNGGTTIRSYTSSLGVTGHFQDYLMVHQRENEKCKVCNSIIVKTTVGGRGTYFCPKCEKVIK